MYGTFTQLRTFVNDLLIVQLLPVLFLGWRSHFFLRGG
jgi:hypothetical protein